MKNPRKTPTAIGTNCTHQIQRNTALLSLVVDRCGNIISLQISQPFFGGYTKNEFSPSLFHYVHPADATRVKQALQQDVSADDIRFRFLCKDDTWLVVSAAIRPSATGTVCLNLAASPVTSLARATEADSRFGDYSFFNSHPLPMFIASAGELNLLELNESAAHHYGYTHNDILGMPIGGLRIEPLAPELQNVLETISVYQGKDRHRKKNGDVIDVEVVAHKLWHEGQEVWVSTIYDITDQTKAIQALAQSELRYRKFVEQSITGIWRYDLREPMPLCLSKEQIIDHFYKHCYLGDCNDAMAKMYGLQKKEDLIGKDCEFFLPRDEPSSIAFFEEYIDSGFTVHNSISYEKDIHGNAKVFLNNYSAHIENGLMIHNWGTQLDITQQRADEESLAYLASIVENSADAIYTLSADKKVLTWNKACEKLSGIKAEEIKGRRVRSFFHYQMLSESYKTIRHTLQQQGSWKGEVMLQYKRSGKSLLALVYVIAQKDKAGTINRLMVFCRDISETKKTEHRLKESEERFINMADKAPAMIYMIDERDRPFYFNCEWLRFTGRTMEEEIATNSLLDIHPDDLEKVKQTYYTNTLARRGFELEYRRKNHHGEFRWVTDRCTPRFLEDGSYIGYVCFCFDIHERRKAEEKSRRQAIQLSGILNSITDGFLAMNNNFTVTMWNKEAERLFGVKAEDIVGKPAHVNFKSYKHTLGAKLLNNALLHKKRVQFEEYVIATKLWCEATLYPYRDGFLLYFKDTTSRRRKQMLLELQKRLLEASANHDLTDAKAAALLTNGIEQIFPGTMSSLCKTNRDTGLFRTVSTQPLLPSLCDHLDKLKIAELFPEEKRETLQPFVVENIQQDSRWQSYHALAKEHNIQTVVVTPIVSSDGKVMSTLNVYHFEACKIEKETLEILQQLAALAAAVDEKKQAENQRKEMEDRLAKEKLEQQRRVSAALLEGVEKQRLDMSRELHDNVCQMLASAKLFVEMSVAENQSEFAKKGIKFVMDALNEIRRLSHELAPPSFRRLSLVDAVKEHISTLKQAHGLNVSFRNTLNGSVEALPADVQLSLYRIVQAQTTNITKYAKAQQVHIALEKDRDKILLTIEDDGVGFDLKKTKRGIGLSNIISRATICNGKAIVTSEPGKGCKVEVQVPLNNAGKSNLHTTK